MRPQCFTSLGHRIAYLITVLFPTWVYVYALCFRLSVFFKALIDAGVSGHAKI